MLSKKCQSFRCRKHSSFHKVLKWAAHIHSLQKTKWDQDYSLEQRKLNTSRWTHFTHRCNQVQDNICFWKFYFLAFCRSCLYRHKMRYSFLNHSKANTKWNAIIYKVKREIRWMKVLTSVVSTSWISLCDDCIE